jgi:phenylpyruvate tautomerase PptA (4-oxalocrotonate tautomerase family)
MPVVTVTLLQGYDEQTREALCRRLTRAVRATMAAPLDGITVAINELQPGSYMRGGVARRPGAPAPDAIALVRDYLAAMEARDLARARRQLADGFVMIFPGGVRLSSLEALVEFARPRYRRVRKIYERFDEAPADDGIVVYCFGTLEGEWPDGTPFAGIRFIDRFTVRDGRLADQQVWNDLAETAARRATQ